MKDARLAAASSTSEASVETESFWKSSSRTLRDLLFSLAITASEAIAGAIVYVWVLRCEGKEEEMSKGRKTNLSWFSKGDSRLYAAESLKKQREKKSPAYSSSGEKGTLGSKEEKERRVELYVLKGGFLRKGEKVRWTGQSELLKPVGEGMKF